MIVIALFVCISLILFSLDKHKKEGFVDKPQVADKIFQNLDAFRGTFQQARSAVGSDVDAVNYTDVRRNLSKIKSPQDVEALL
jgi:hypothetical protein